MAEMVAAFRPVPACCGASERTFISKKSETDRPRWPETKLEEALRRIGELEQRVAELEARS